MTVKRVGVDLAKTVFQVHGVDERERAVLRKRLKRSELLNFFAQLPACVVGMEACGSATPISGSANTTVASKPSPARWHRRSG